MAAFKKFNACAKVGEFQVNGTTKNRWITIGSVYENENGNLSLMLESVPTGHIWDGWVSFFPVKQSNGKKLANDIPF